MHGNQPRMKEHVRCDDTFCQRISACEVDDRTEWRRGWQTAAPHYFLASEGAAANGEPGPVAAANWFRDRDFDRVAGR